uniref:hypothetical protein n=1 Tax=Candidatus Methylacidithermus pantelleriae TaxID=2744239 RepID=UPI0038B3B36A
MAVEYIDPASTSPTSSCCGSLGNARDIVPSVLTLVPGRTATSTQVGRLPRWARPWLRQGRP